MRLARWPFLLGVALAAPGCGGDPGNPFTPLAETNPPAAEDDVTFLSNLHTPASPLRDLYAIQTSGAAEPQRLTFCSEEEVACDTLQAVPNPDRTRVAVRRIRGDSNRDGVLTAIDGVNLEVVDLDRGLSTVFVPAAARVSGVDWSPAGDVLVYTGRNPGGASTGSIGDDDIFRIDGDRQNPAPVTQSPNVLERNPRIDPQGQFAVFERVLPDPPPTFGQVLEDPKGIAEVWIFQTSFAQQQVTSVTEPGERLPNTVYLVGSTTDPVFSPDRARVAYRRLTGTGIGGWGTWELWVANSNGANPRLLRGGPLFRSGPDWSGRGLIVAETDPAAGTTQLLVLDPDSGASEVVLTLDAAVRIDGPRWLVPAS